MLIRPIPRQRGFSLIEMAVVVAILGVVMAVGIPSYSAWIENSRARVHVESISDGLRYARGEAIRRNARVIFQLTNNLTATCSRSATGRSWMVSLANVQNLCDQPLSDTSAPQGLKRSPTTTSTDLTITTNTVNASGVATSDTVRAITFNPMGRVATVESGGGSAVAVQSGVWINVTNTKLDAASQRPLRITISPSGQIRTCDPSTALTTTDPRRCA